MNMNIERILLRELFNFHIRFDLRCLNKQLTVQLQKKKLIIEKISPINFIQSVKLTGFAKRFFL